MLAMQASVPWDTSCRDWADRIVSRRSLIPDLPYDEPRWQKALRIFKRLKLVDVPGNPTMGEACDEWVFDFVKAIFGAFHPDTKRRVIREYFLLISKKNGKSSVAAGVMLTALIMNERTQGEYLILAPTKDVADNSFIVASGMVNADPALLARYKPSNQGRVIENRLDHSTLEVKSADADVIGGQKAIAVFIDELWLFGKKAQAANILSEATGSLAARPEGFVIYASTQSDDPPAGVFKSKLEYFREVRDGVTADQTSLALIYEYPEAMIKAEAWRDPQTWFVTNPSIGRSVDPDWLTGQMTKSEREGSAALQLFKSKHFNIQPDMGAHTDAWEGAPYWASRADPDLKSLDNLLERSEVVVVGVDGGGLEDLFGLCVIGREKETRRYLVWVHAWVHSGVLTRRKAIASRLQDYADAGELTIVDDALEDNSEIVEVIVRCDQAGILHAVMLDTEGPYAELVDGLAQVGITAEENGRIKGVRQGIFLMSAIKGSARKVVNGTLLHSGSSMMAWCIGNLKIERTATAIRATKLTAVDNKVDPAFAMFDAFSEMVTNPTAGRSIYEDRGIRMA